MMLELGFWAVLDFWAELGVVDKLGIEWPWVGLIGVGVLGEGKFRGMLTEG